jgi:predicted Zn-dependent protease
MRGKAFAFDLLDATDELLRDEGLDGKVVWCKQALSTLLSARNPIHQASITREQLVKIYIRDQENREGSIVIVSPNLRHIKQAILYAKGVLRDTPPNPYGADLAAPPADFPEEQVIAWDEDTAAGDLTRRSEFFERVNKIAARANLVASARFYTGEEEIAVGNTLGLRRYHRFTTASCELVLKGASNSNNRHVSAFAARSGKSLDDIDPDEVIVEALESATLQTHLPFMDPFQEASNGEERTFDVILRPYALGAWLWWLGLYEFSGVSLFNETSFFTDAIGGLVTSQDITIVDDWHYSHMIAAPFDTEGVTRERVPLIERGIARGVVCDSATAKKAELPPTGHAVLSNYPQPLHLVFEGGSHSFEELIDSCKRPTILITYFNYPSMPDPRTGVFTATTRHGTFLIEGGKFRNVLPPLRFLERTLEAFARIEAKTKPKLVIEQDQYEGIEPSSYAVPAVKIKDMHFVESVT